MIIKKYKSKLIFTLCFIGFSILSLFTNLVRSNKIKWEKPDKITFQDSINYNAMYSESYYGLFNNFVDSDSTTLNMLRNYSLFLSGSYDDINNNEIYYDFVYTFEYQTQDPLKTDFDIFRDNGTYLDYNKILPLVLNRIDYYVSINDPDYTAYKNNVQYPINEIRVNIGLSNYALINVNSSNFKENLYYINSSSNVNVPDSFNVPDSNYFLDLEFFDNSYNDIDINLSFHNNYLSYDIIDLYMKHFSIPLFDINNSYPFYEFSFKNNLIDSTLVSQVNRLQRQLDDLNYVYGNTLLVNSQLNDTIRDLQTRLDLLNIEVNGLSAENSQYATDIEYYQNQITQLNLQINTLNSLLNSARNSEWNFNRLMFNIASTPLESFKTFYDVEFWGINLSDLFLGILFSGLIFFLFRRFIGSFFSL